MATTTENTREMMEMFVDGTDGESYKSNRMITTESESGSIILIAYGWLKLAEYDESESHVTVFFGHKSLDSRTVSRWLNRLIDVASERRDFTISHESPVVRRPNDGTEYIGSYIGDYADMSSVEQQAVEKVVQSLAFLDRFL